ncbi:mak10 amino-acid n-acetyltransferase subunit, putative [Ichthyophthirius multifiliis]|uniref:Mak10 amino-acid n-acetyltransferase subunit, putative n=1 Tax=Ichthyophthirius multifiliis TaxID=5932 RepID=G0QT10_ICHMU|nr:mak10 amino-acid n-acetyltransferase subunit, putative [Ichthyophthirius multifiliis]EGR31646.1 mak10 amino-acid n-acetyltransferase subunit, putative [Ichthyophthirius multifiliis]|eukprot:XP_004035132.1 mak10 amino-acid n-acetyltransferase subunit, putative [Ichthyophthirius multifiliis]
MQNHQLLNNFEDITNLVNNVCLNMQLGETISTKEFTFYDSMSSSEIGDPKMDIKVGYKDVKHPIQLIKDGEIKAAENLTNHELIHLIDYLLALEFTWLKGYSLSQTLYQFVYFYDENSYKNNLILKSYIECLYLNGIMMFETVRYSPFLKEDDYTITVFSFPEQKDEQTILNQISEAENLIGDKITNPNLRKKKKNINLNEYDAIDSRLKFLSPRPYLEMKIEDGFSMIESFLESLEYILSLAKEQNFYAILEKIIEFKNLPKNIFAKTYLDCNIFYSTGKYFSIYDMGDMVKNIFKDFGLSDSTLNSQSFLEYSYQCQIVCQNYITKYLSNQYRQYRDYCKIYQELSILISQSDKYEKEFLIKKDEAQTATTWSYNLACRMMAQHLHLGFQLELFDLADYCQIFFILEFVYRILEINTQSLMLIKFDKQFILAFQTKQNLDQAKKKLKPFQKQWFYYYIFYKGLQLYAKANSHICFLLEKYSLIPQFNDPETLKNRFANRFKIFENAFFLKMPTYQQYQEKVSEGFSKEKLDQYCEEIKQTLSQAQQLFQQIPENEEVVPLGIRNDAKKLIKVCILSSLSAMKIKLKKNDLQKLKGSFSSKEHIYYPYPEIL